MFGAAAKSEAKVPAGCRSGVGVTLRTFGRGIVTASLTSVTVITEVVARSAGLAGIISVRMLEL
jgi:hypothetical protein